MNTKTEKPKSFGPKTEKPIEKIAKTAKPKIPMPPRRRKTEKIDALSESILCFKNYPGVVRTRVESGCLLFS